jgi:hypothetical protein
MFEHLQTGDEVEAVIGEGQAGSVNVVHQLQIERGRGGLQRVEAFELLHRLLFKLDVPIVGNLGIVPGRAMFVGVFVVE